MNLFHKWIHKYKSMLFTLRFSILFIFVSFFVIAMLLLITITYIRFTSAMSYVSSTLMQQASTSVLNFIKNETRDDTIESQFAGKLIKSGVVSQNNQAEITQYTFDLLDTEGRTLPSMHSVFWADEKGNFVSAKKEETNDSITSEVIDLKKQPETRKVIYRDTQGNITKQLLFHSTSYAPSVWPWYAAAKNAKKTVWTDVYPSHTTGHLGITSSTPVYDSHGKFRGVFALNSRLDYLRHFIETIFVSEHSIIYLVTTKGKVIAYPHISQYKNKMLMDVHSLPLPWVIQSFDEHKKTGKQSFTFKYNNKNYLARYDPISDFSDHGWMIGVIIPEDDFVGKLRETNLVTVSLSLIILVLGILLVSALVSRLVRPLKKLTKEIDKIKNFDLRGDTQIYSRIKEIMHISSAFYAMKRGLRSFQKYVPATLVRQLIETGEDARIGGMKKPLAVFFSDIRDFTTTAELVNPDVLSEYLCEYFEEMSHIIVDTRGTIDKYIGDSIMAFWGAPLPEKEPCQQAAIAALHCKKRLVELNIKWKREGKPVLFTRIGIHTGEAIVGNFGSTERLNYTAVGDVINTASRLEGINKIYGTQIIVSEAVYKIIKDKFVLRMLDCITVKGRIETSYVYELIAEHRDEITFDIEKYSLIFAVGFAAYQKQHWDQAIHYFSDCLLIYPDDFLVPHFIKRCEEFKTHPPAIDWDGVWHISEK